MGNKVQNHLTKLQMLFEINNIPKNKINRFNFEVCPIRFEIIMAEDRTKNLKLKTTKTLLVMIFNINKNKISLVEANLNIRLLKEL